MAAVATAGAMVVTHHGRDTMDLEDLIIMGVVAATRAAATPVVAKVELVAGLSANSATSSKALWKVCRRWGKCPA